MKLKKSMDKKITINIDGKEYQVLENKKLVERFSVFLCLFVWAGRQKWQAREQ